MIYSEQAKHFTLHTTALYEESLEEVLSTLSIEELAALEFALENPAYERDLIPLELDRTMVPVDQWLKDPYYMGNIGKDLYKPWQEDLIELCESEHYSTALIVGSLGSGKSTFAQLAVLRMLYEASCLKNPQTSYGLAQGSMIAFCNLAKSKETARRAVFEALVAKIRESPYFTIEFPPIKDSKDELIFPKNLAIIAGSSTDTSIIGMNIAGGIIDEANFFLKSGGSVVQSLDSGVNRWGQYARIGRLYESVVRRIKSRFNKYGKLPGMLIVTSSKTTKDSFTERIVRKARAENDKSLFIKDRAVIDVKRQYFSKEIFKVLVGTEQFPSRILAPDEDVSDVEDAMVVEIPEDFRDQFNDNIEESLRELAGISTVAIASFMTRVDLVESMLDFGRSHPFVCPLMDNPTEWDSRLPYTINWNKLSRRRENGEWEPILNPHAKRWVHLDPASTGDAFALAIGHVCGFSKAVETEAEESDEIQEMQPSYIVDFILRIRGEKGSEILFKNVRKIIYKFSEHGFHIAGITTDSYQSREMIQALSDQGYKASLVSVDTSKDPYLLLRRTIYDARIKCYDYPILYRELKSLEDTPTKIDHPVNGSKDTADAICGMVWGLFNEHHYGDPVLPEKGVSEYAGVPSGEVPVPINENFEPLKTQEYTDVVISPSVQQPSTVKVYQKNRPKTLAPSYKKVGSNGQVVDMIKKDDDDHLFMRG